MSHAYLPHKIRQAQYNDSIQIRLVATLAWTHAYRELIAPDAIANYLHTACSLKSIRQFIDDASSTTVIAERAMPPKIGEIVGFSHVRQHLADSASDQSIGELSMLAIHPDAQNQAVGYGLWRAGLAWFLQRDIHLIQTNVLAMNKQGCAFLERQGAKIVNIESGIIGTQTLPVAIYQIRI